MISISNLLYIRMVLVIKKKFFEKLLFEKLVSLMEYYERMEKIKGNVACEIVKLLPELLTFRILEFLCFKINVSVHS